MLISRMLLAGVIAILLIAITAIILLVLPAQFWDSWQPASCLPTGCFCEAINQSSSIRQQANTWSSLAYVLIGVFIAGFVGYSSDKLFDKRTQLAPVYSYLLAFATIVVGLGSAFYHASMTFVGQFVDILGMYLVTSFMLVYAARRLYGLTTSTTITIYVLLNIGLAVIQLLIPDTRRYVFAILLIAAVLLESYLQLRKRLRISARWFIAGLALFSVAYLIWILDNSKVLCNPDSIIQGHAVWHIMGAIAIAFLYVYYASEKSSVKTTPV